MRISPGTAIAATSIALLAIVPLITNFLEEPFYLGGIECHRSEEL